MSNRITVAFAIIQCIASILTPSHSNGSLPLPQKIEIIVESNITECQDCYYYEDDQCCECSEENPECCI